MSRRSAFAGRDGRPILMGISFRAEPGKILGIIGPSGSGKTTLGKIIVGAIQPTIGAVRIDGARLTDWDQDELGISATCRRTVAVRRHDQGKYLPLPQRAATMRTQGIDKAVVAAAKEAGVHELILQLPQGYDTPLGLMGAGLSAGQSQRSRLPARFTASPAARARRAQRISRPGRRNALDRRACQGRERGATVIVIAHRRGVLDAADRLLVLEEGRPKMIGPAADVVAG